MWAIYKEAVNAVNDSAAIDAAATLPFPDLTSFHVHARQGTMLHLLLPIMYISLAINSAHA